MRNLAVAGSALVAIGAIAAACTSTGGESASHSSSLTFDPLPSQAPSGAEAVPGAPRQMTPTPTPPPATKRVTEVVVPPARTVTAAPAAPTAAAPTSPPAPTVSATPDADATGEPGGAGPSSPDAPGSDARRGGPERNGADPAEAAATPTFLADGSVDCAQSKCIALTFSGGPSDQSRRFLQILESHGGKGTFFVTGEQVAQRPDVMTAIAGTGNEVANGTWSQPNMTELSPGEDLRQLTRTNDAVEQTVGVTPTLFRPMGGHTSPAVVQAGEEAGLTQVLWDLDTRDYAYQSDPGALAEVIAGAEPGQVVMLHDTFPATATALDRALTELAAKGYAFVTVSHLYRTR